MPNPILRKAISQVDRILQSILPDHSVVAEGDDISEIIPWTKAIDAELEQLTNEAEVVLKRFHELPRLGEVGNVGAGYNRDINWKLYPFSLMRNNLESPLETPAAQRFLKSVPMLVNSFFSILPPDTELLPHNGTSRLLTRCHVGIRIPEDRSKCFFFVDNHRHEWNKGRWLVFDQTFEHYAKNNTDEYRILLILDVVRHDLPPVLRWMVFNAIRFLKYHPEARLTVNNYRRIFKTL